MKPPGLVPLLLTNSWCWSCTRSIVCRWCICKMYDVIDRYAIDVEGIEKILVRNAGYTGRKRKPSAKILQFICTPSNQIPGKNRKRMAKPPKILCCHPDVSPGFFFFLSDPTRRVDGTYQASGTYAEHTTNLSRTTLQPPCNIPLTRPQAPDQLNLYDTIILIQTGSTSDFLPIMVLRR